MYLIFSESLLQNKNFSIITLPHPAYGTASKFCLDDENRNMFEVVTFGEPNRSWFIGETVKSDGSLLILTPINPTYLGKLLLKLLLTILSKTALKLKV